MPGVAEDFLWILINGLLYSKDCKWLLFSYLRNEACPLWKAVSQVCFSNVNDRATVCSSPLKARHQHFSLLVKMLCGRNQLLVHIQNAASIVSLLEAWGGRSHLMWCMHHLNGCELLGLEPGALSMQRSAGECALLPFQGKLRDFFPHPNRNEREGWTIARQQEEMSLRSQQFSLLNKSAVGR